MNVKKIQLRNLFEILLQKIRQKLINQNILISNKETSTEEIKDFLYRGVLWDYNSLFVVEINKLLSLLVWYNI